MVQPSLSTQATESAVLNKLSRIQPFYMAETILSGTIIFTAYGPVDRDAPMPECTEVAFVSDPVVVNGNGTYGPVTSCEVPGIYYWIASYSGDSHNLPVMTHCGDQGEMSVVKKSAKGGITTSRKFFRPDRLPAIATTTTSSSTTSSCASTCPSIGPCTSFGTRPSFGPSLGPGVSKPASN